MARLLHCKLVVGIITFPQPVRKCLDGRTFMLDQRSYVSSTFLMNTHMESVFLHLNEAGQATKRAITTPLTGQVRQIVEVPALHLLIAIISL